MNRKICIIGFGQMGAAIARGLLNKGWSAENLTAIDPTSQAQERATALSITYAPHFTHQQADVLLLAVKPQMMAEVCAPLPTGLDTTTLVVSIAAGITLHNLEDWLGHRPIVRAMPNTPAAIGEGVTVCVPNQAVTPAQQQLATELLAAVGEVHWLKDEDLMNAVTAVSGSGPAYFFLLMEALEEAAISEGLSADLARQLVLKTAAGAGALAWQQREARSPADQRIAVTSPGGTTEAGLQVFAAAEFKSLVKMVVTAARKRGDALSS